MGNFSIHWDKWRSEARINYKKKSQEQQVKVSYVAPWDLYTITGEYDLRPLEP